MRAALIGNATEEDTGDLIAKHSNVELYEHGIGDYGYGWGPIFMGFVDPPAAKPIDILYTPDHCFAVLFDDGSLWTAILKVAGYLGFTRADCGTVVSIMIEDKDVVRASQKRDILFTLESGKTGLYSAAKMDMVI